VKVKRAMSTSAAIPSVSQLGYLVFEASDLDAWRRFADVLGLGVIERSEGAIDLRMDGHAARFHLQQGPANDLVAVGWEAGSGAELDQLVARLREHGVDVTEASADDARTRGVERLYRFVDPSGIPGELCFGAKLANDRFRSDHVASAFVADSMGLGHVVLACRDMQESATFYTELLGFRLSDRIRCDLHGFQVDVLFYHCNQRHHSLALGGPQEKRLHHFMLEVADLDDVGMCFDRALKAGVPLMQTIGRHPNDRMVSFYALTPSGFQFEFGWGGRIVDDASWETTEYDRISDWGHTRPKLLTPRKEVPRG